MSIQDFQIITKLGQGAYSSVFKVKRHIDESVYALKKVKLLNLSSREIFNAVNQVRILASIRHPNIIGYKEAFYDQASKSLCIVMEYADGGDLLQKIFKHKKTNTLFQQQYIWDIFQQMLKGLKTLHQLKILHRDIKSANVFLTKSGQAKLGDMNVSKVIRKQSMCQTQTGTPYYASPQVWNDAPYDSKSDIWSLGCVLYQLISLRPPFRSRDMQGLYRKVSRGYYPRIHKNYSEDLSKVLKLLIRVNPEQRLSCQQILDHPIIKKRMKKIKEQQLQEESILLKTIKLSKNINYLTQKLPKPNYSPLRFKNSPNKSSLEKGSYKNPYELQFSLPPINKSHRGSSMQNPENILISKKSLVNKRYARQNSLPKILNKSPDRYNNKKSFKYLL